MSITAASPVLSLSADKPLDPMKFENWIGELRANKGQDLLRYKGILDMEGSNAKLALQGVHMMMEGSNLAPWKAGEKRQSRLVFIGRNLDEAALRAGFASTVAARYARLFRHRPPMEFQRASHSACHQPARRLAGHGFGRWFAAIAARQR